MSTWVWMEGRVSPADEASVPVTDRSVLLGMGVFETCLVVDGIPFALSRHLERLRSSARSIGLEVPWGDDEVREACAQLLRETPVAEDGAGMGGAGMDGAGMGGADEGDIVRLRITVTGGSAPLGPSARGGAPRLVVAIGVGAAWGPTASVVTDGRPINERGAAVGVKTTSHLEQVVILDEARGRGADEAIRSNTVGQLCEGTGSNLFLEVDGELCTPSLSTGCLAGVTRALVLELVAVTERDDLTFGDLHRSREAFLTSSTRGVHPVATVDGVALPAVPGPLTSSAATAFRALVAASPDP